MKQTILPALFMLCMSGIAAQSIENGLVPKGGLSDSLKVYSLADRMAFYNVPGVSITLFYGGKMISNEVYGVSDNSKGIQLDTITRFQAASVSKPVTALAVLRLAEQHNLDIDRDINDYLKSWKVRENRFTEKEKVTIRRLLNHTAGINVGGFGGYEKGKPILSLIDLLNGKGNSPAIKVIETPGKKYMYSGGGYLILQQLVEDITGTAFADYMQKEILLPLGMVHSSFEPEPLAKVSLAHKSNGEPYPAGWYRMPESAPAGLWTTGADLARFCMALQQAYDGKENSWISQVLVKIMLSTTGSNGYGLGLALRGKGENVLFYHGGRNRGYNNVILDLYHHSGGLGIVILTNSDRGDELRDEILRSFGRYYKVPVMAANGQ